MPLLQNYNLKVRVLLLLLSLSLCAAAQTVDSDHDGLSDSLEQTLLARFRPTFMTSAHDCAVRPARFKADSANPEPIAADGTIYGQVFPAAEHRIEIHYYTLWDKDCGRVSHPLDAEHVSALISTEDADPKALYWYSSAHEKTVCDISSGTRAKSIDAETKGPVIWSATGKHALYFDKKMCSHGCGADSCEDDIELAATSPVINLGELNAPLNGSTFAASPKWLLASKMNTDFPAPMIAVIEAAPANSIATVRGRSTIRGTIQGSAVVYDNIADSASTASQHTGAALDTAQTHTTNSLDKATKSTGNALTRAWHFVTRQKPDPK